MASESDSGPTLLGPLTTIFTPPASCQDLTVLSISTVFKTTITVTNTIADGSVVSVSTIPTTTTSRTAYLEKYDYILDSDCYPPGYTTYSAYYSPGRCPSAWEGVITTAQNGETTVQCCPTSFIFSGQLCRSTVTGDPTLPVVLYKNNLRVDPTPTPSSIPDDNVWATGIVVRYRDGDFDITTDSKTTIAKSTAAPTDTASPSSDGSSSGLSLGGKVGLGVGIPAAALLVAVLAFLFFHRRRSNSTVATVPGPPPQELQSYSQPPPQQYYQPMQQSLPAGYWETKPAEMARASEIYTSSAAGSPRPRVQSTGYVPVAQVGAYGSAHDSYAPTVGPEQGGYGQEARAPSAASGYAPAAGHEYQQDATQPTVQSQGLSPPPTLATPTQRSGFGGPLPDPSELYPEYGAAGDDNDSLHGVRR